MNYTTMITVTLGLVIGSAIGLASFSGVIDFAALGISQPEDGTAIDGENKEGAESSVAPTVEKKEGVEANSAKSETNEKDLAVLAKAEAYLKRHPEDRKRAIVFGGMLVKKSEYERAIEFYEERLSNNPEDPEFWYGLGWACEKSKQWAQAIHGYEKAYEADYRHIGALNNLAWVLATAPDETVRDGKRAVKLAKRAMRMAGPQALFAADTLAAAFAESGDFDSAIELQELVFKKSVYKNQKQAQERLELYEQDQAYRLK
jgi:tetratricopeptide (TPR) repeat protein